MHTLVRLDPTTSASFIAASFASPAMASSDATANGHHSTVAGIPAPLAISVGAIVLVLVILLAVTALTRRRCENDDRTFHDRE